MGEPEQDDELAVQVARDHRLEVELDVGRPGEALAVAEQAELLPVGDHAPEAVGAVQVILDQGVRALAGLAPAVELLVVGDDVDRRRAFLLAREVGDGEARAARPAERRADRSRSKPSRPSTGSIQRSRVSEVALPWWRARALEGLPLALDVGEGRLDLLGQPSAVEAEVGRPLARHLLGAGAQALEQIGREQAALDGDRDVRHQPVLPVGTRTKQPMTSGGSWAWISSRGALVRRRRRACASASAATRCSITGRYHGRRSRGSRAPRPDVGLSGCGMLAVGSARSASPRPGRSAPASAARPSSRRQAASTISSAKLSTGSAPPVSVQQVADAQQQQDRAPVHGIGEDRAGAREVGGRSDAKARLSTSSATAATTGCVRPTGSAGSRRASMVISERELEAGLILEPGLELARDQLSTPGLPRRAQLTAQRCMASARNVDVSGSPSTLSVASSSRSTSSGWMPLCEKNARSSFSRARHGPRRRAGG